MKAAVLFPRDSALGKARRLEYFTLAWNSLEALISIVAGALSGSIALVGFGLDSVIENASAVALLWRLRKANERSEQQREHAEAIALRIVGALFLLLAAYVAFDSAWMLFRRAPVERSLAGIVITALSIVVMPLLSRAKRKTAAELGSKALEADSRQTDFCLYLSVITLCGLVLNGLFGWWWADPAAALVASPIFAWEGFRSLRGDACGCATSGLPMRCSDSACGGEEKL
jgi:divalent metal cation (Fe/Co/Zn/Cd) transporter